MGPEEQALAQAIGGGGEEGMAQEVSAGPDIQGVTQLLEQLIEAGKLDPQTAEMIMQAIAGGSGME
jgi:hypothetical protein